MSLKSERIGFAGGCIVFVRGSLRHDVGTFIFPFYQSHFSLLLISKKTPFYYLIYLTYNLYLISYKRLES